MYCTTATAAAAAAAAEPAPAPTSLKDDTVECVQVVFQHLAEDESWLTGITGAAHSVAAHAQLPACAVNLRRQTTAAHVLVVNDTKSHVHVPMLPPLQLLHHS